MPDNEQRCAICGRDAHATSIGDRDLVQCARCGNFEIVRSAKAAFDPFRSDADHAELLPYLSAYTRQASERHQNVVLDTRNWKHFALAHKETSLSRKATKVLELIAARSKPGSPVRFDPKIDPPLVDAASPSELAFLLEHLGELGYLRQNEGWVYTLKAKGWEKLEAATTKGGIPGKCFVAMSFHNSLKGAYENGIYLAVKEDCNMEPVRIDRVHHNEKICDKIIAEIRTCQFLVADCTPQRAGVYFEAGFAMGLGRQVIWTCRDDDFKNVHFDTRQYNHIVWQSPEDLRAKLTDRIRATIPRGD